MDSAPGGLSLPEKFAAPQMVMPGVLALKGPAFSDFKTAETEINRLCQTLSSLPEKEALPLIIVTDDAEFTARTLNNFLWVTFTRSNPSHDIYGVNSFMKFKHWGCDGPLIIDARLKPHHAPPLTPDPAITARVDELGKKGGPLHGII
jgi:4-hydroxy-3-polyprenylbenzoate decarboxylase